MAIMRESFVTCNGETETSKQSVGSVTTERHHHAGLDRLIVSEMLVAGQESDTFFYCYIFSCHCVLSSKIYSSVQIN